MRAPESWSALLGSLSRADHPIHFCAPEQELPQMVQYLGYSLRSDAKVITLWHKDRITELRAALGDMGHLKELESGRMAIYPLEDFTEPMAAVGRPEPGTGPLREAVNQAFDKGFQEVRVGGAAAGALFSRGHYGLARDLEAFWHEMVHRMPVSVYCPYPVANPDVDPAVIRGLAEVHNWVVAGPKAYAVNLAGAALPV